MEAVDFVVRPTAHRRLEGLAAPTTTSHAASTPAAAPTAAPAITLPSIDNLTEAFVAALHPLSPHDLSMSWQNDSVQARIIVSDPSALNVSTIVARLESGAV